MSEVSLRGLGLAYGDTWALRGVDLDLPAGSLTAVLGRSGCGKTTMLRLLAGFLDPDEGEIRLDGERVAVPGSVVPARARRIGYVPQEGALFPHLSVAENVLFGLPRAQRRSRRLLGELLELVALEPDLAARMPAQLSGGQQQRVAVARTLALSPGLVLLDEPFNSLDEELREETASAVLGALRSRGTTAVLVTHDQGEALSLADLVVVLRGGRVAQVGDPDEVYRAPVDREVASFLGSAVLLPGVVHRTTLSCALGELPAPAGAVAGSVEVLLRPEQISLGPHGLPATVIAVAFFGHDATVTLELDELATGLRARVSGSARPAVGDRTRVTVAGEVQCLPAGLRAAPPRAPALTARQGMR